MDSTLGDFRANENALGSSQNRYINLNSQLPYVVVIFNLQNDGYYNNIGFRYGSYSFRGDFACSNRDGINVCQHAFPC